MAIGTLYLEELRATARGRFALVGAGVVLLAVGCVAAVGTQDTWLDGYGIIAYFLVPLAFIPLTAVFLASPRANRFVESVFTAPVEDGRLTYVTRFPDEAARKQAWASFGVDPEWAAVKAASETKGPLLKNQVVSVLSPALAGLLLG